MNYWAVLHNEADAGDIRSGVDNLLRLASMTDGLGLGGAATGNPPSSSCLLGSGTDDDSNDMDIDHIDGQMGSDASTKMGTIEDGLWIQIVVLVHRGSGSSLMC
jgi:hypothetical protein